MIKYCEKKGNERLVKTLGSAVLCFNVFPRKDKYQKGLKKYHVDVDSEDEDVDIEEEKEERIESMDAWASSFRRSWSDLLGEGASGLQEEALLHQGFGCGVQRRRDWQRPEPWLGC